MEKLLDDCRSIVSNAKTADSKKTVAMDCIRMLEANPSNVSAIIPMLLEVYFKNGEVVAAAIDKAIATHKEGCVGKGSKLIKLLNNIGWPGVAIVAIIRIEAIVIAIQKVF